MLRALASICIEGGKITRRDIFKVFRIYAHSGVANVEKTVLTSTGGTAENATRGSGAGGAAAGSGPAPPPPPPGRPPRAWAALAALSAAAASLGGVYLYRKLNEDVSDKSTKTTSDEEKTKDEVEVSSPANGDALPEHVQYLLVGGGTASFAAMRAIRSARPDAQVLIVAAEPALPYMRPPLSKELWREPDLAQRAAAPDSLTFRQWNGRRRSLTYEPAAFYTPAESLGEGGAGAGVARGWRVTRLDPARRSASMVTVAGAEHTLTYDKCLLATGVRPRRVPALRAAAAEGRSLALRGVRDVARLAAALDDPAVRSVAVVGGGFLATELAVALADRLREDGKRVTQVFRESAPLAGVLPRYLADDVARRLAEAGVALVPGAEVAEARVRDGRVSMRLAAGGALEAELVVECAGSEPEAELARAAGLELHAELGGVLVNAELQARSGLFAAGDVACFYDEALGRRRVEHHDHAVLSGRLAGENMAAAAPPRHYQHQSMFWSDLGPRLGYEAIGIIDASLPTVGVFSADSVGDEATEARMLTVREEAAEGRPEGVSLAAREEGDASRAEGASLAAREEGGASRAEGASLAAREEGGASRAEGASLAAREEGGASRAEGAEGAPRRFERGVVFYVRERRVVGVLLWNLFNRMHVARQVISKGDFDDLFEVAKLFSPHEED